MPLEPRCPKCIAVVRLSDLPLLSSARVRVHFFNTRRKWINYRHQALCRILLEQILFADKGTIEPTLILVRAENHHHPFFIIWLVESLHERVPIGIYRQHRERQQQILQPEFPYPGDGDRHAIGALDAPADRLPGFVAGFKEVIGRDNAELFALPGIAKRWLLRHGFGAGVVGLARQLHIGPMGHHPETCRRDFQLTGHVVRGANDRRHVAGPGFRRQVKLRGTDSKMLFDLIATAGGIVGAHAIYSTCLLALAAAPSRQNTARTAHSRKIAYPLYCAQTLTTPCAHPDTKAN